jgi:branched-chain amino acid transport system ATP-binding protein
MPEGRSACNTSGSDILLETRGVTKAFGGVTAVDNVSLRIPNGRLHAIIGPNGAGKTTLFHLLTGTLPVTAGEIVFDGAIITGEVLSKRVKRGLARSYQKTSIFPRLSVRDNILAAAYRAEGVGPLSFLLTTARVQRAAELADEILVDLGLSALAEAEAQTLPYGAQRLIDIGMALACKPKLLLLDEPTSGLSSGELDETIAYLNSLRSRYTILLIEHNMDLVLEFAEVITVLNFGRVISEGPPAKVSADVAVQEAYFGKAGARQAEAGR